MTSSVKQAIIALHFIVVVPLGVAQEGNDGNSVYQYQGKVTGLYCSACSEKVKAALKKLAGVSEVKITKGKTQGVQEISLQSTSDSLTSEAAMKTLGEDAKIFTILGLDRVAAEK